MGLEFYESPVSVEQIDAAAVAAADGELSLANEARAAFLGHRRKLLREISTNVPRPTAEQAMEQARQLEALLEQRIAQEAQRKHDAAMLNVAKATEDQTKKLTWATWALVLATIVLAGATIWSMFDKA